MTSFPFISHQVAIYCGISILAVGFVGNLLNCIIFLSLRTFRTIPCGFYLIIMSMYNIGQLITSVFSRIMITGFGIDWTQSSWFFCKFRMAILHLCSLGSFTCMCLATIDQYMVTCSRQRWQKCSNIRLARFSCLSVTVFWICHEIPAFLSYNLIQTSNSNDRICMNTNYRYQQYVTFIYLPILTGILPLTITTLFASLAYRNVRQIPYRTIPIVRRELDKQLTSMVLVQVVQIILVTVPFIIINILIRATNLIRDSFLEEQLNFAYGMIGYIYYLYFSSPFYIYFCVSKRFRQQLHHVLFDVSIQKNQPRIIFLNQIAPDS